MNGKFCIFESIAHYCRRFEKVEIKRIADTLCVPTYRHAAWKKEFARRMSEEFNRKFTA